MKTVDIKDYEGRYTINEAGEVYSLITNKQLKGVVTKAGYVQVTLCKDSKHKTTHQLHRLVADHFLTNVNNLPQVNHINGVKTANYVRNLEWCTSKHNIEHSIKEGLATHQKRKLSDADITMCRQLHDKGASIEYLMNMYGMSRTAIRKYIYPFGAGSTRGKKVRQLTADGVCIREWGSMIIAAQALNVDVSSISAVCRNKQNTAHGFRWEVV